MEEILKQLFLDRSAATLHDAAARNAQFRAQQADRAQLKSIGARLGDLQGRAEQDHANWVGRMTAPRIRVGSGDVITENPAGSRIAGGLSSGEVADYIGSGTPLPPGFDTQVAPWDVPGMLPDALASQQEGMRRDKFDAQKRADIERAWKGVPKGQLPHVIPNVDTMSDQELMGYGPGIPDNVDHTVQQGGGPLGIYDDPHFGRGPATRPMFTIKGGTYDAGGGDTGLESPNLHPMLNPDDLPFSVRMFPQTY